MIAFDSGKATPLSRTRTGIRPLGLMARNSAERLSEGVAVISKVVVWWSMLRLERRRVTL